MEQSAVSLQTICDGGVPEVFERELREVLTNIADPNTQPDKTRTITLKFTFKPSEDRQLMVVDFICRASLQPVKIRKSQLFLSRHTGFLKAYASDQRQAALFGPEAEPSAPISAVK